MELFRKRKLPPAPEENFVTWNNLCYINCMSSAAQKYDQWNVLRYLYHSIAPCVKLLYSPGQTPKLRGQAHHPHNSNLTSSGQNIAEVDNFWASLWRCIQGLL